MKNFWIEIKKVAVIVVLSLWILFVVILFIQNALNNDKFLEMNANNFLTLVVAVYFAFYLTQKKNEYRLRRTKLESLLYEYKNTIQDDRFFDICNNEDAKYLIQSHRKLNNLITVMRSIKVDLDTEVFLAYIENKMDEHNNLISNHLSDIGYLTKSSTELMNYRDLADFKINELIVKMYSS